MRKIYKWFRELRFPPWLVAILAVLLVIIGISRLVFYGEFMRGACDLLLGFALLVTSIDHYMNGY